MRCPHCLVSFHHHPQSVWSGKDVDGGWGVYTDLCPACRRIILLLASGFANTNQFGQVVSVDPHNWTLIHPRSASRTPAPDDVPKHISADYAEACLVLGDSPKASAALSRRCLQTILREAAKVKAGDLATEISELLGRNELPTHIRDAIDAVRNIGNFSAHPIKSTQTGEIVPVEPGESEWNLDVLESLFDFYYVQPATTKRKRDALNKKLAEAGKPAMK